MSVLIETSLGDIVIDLFVEDVPQTAQNFLSLCRTKYYNGVLFFNVQRGLLIQTGDPTGTGEGGESIFARRPEAPTRYFADELRPYLKHARAGTVGMASAGPDRNGSQFYITSEDGASSLDGRHTVFGRVAEGLAVVRRIADTLADARGRPLQNIRVRHTLVLDDPTPPLPWVAALVPPASPLRRLGGLDRLEIDEALPSAAIAGAAAAGGGEGEEKGDAAKAKAKAAQEAQEEREKEAEARSRASVLELVQDLPYADIRPPENILFVCRLNPATDESGLELIFSRFGRVHGVDVIRDAQTGQSLCYAFVEFEREEDAQRAYAKMDNVLVDDRRIHVDFCQSIARNGVVLNYRHKAGKWVPVAPEQQQKQQQLIGGRAEEIFARRSRRHTRRSSSSSSSRSPSRSRHRSRSRSRSRSHSHSHKGHSHRSHSHHHHHHHSRH